MDAVTLNWTQAGVILAVIVPLVTFVGWVVATKVESAVALLQRDMEHNRGVDKEEMRQWINGSFMRANEVRAIIESMDRRVTAVERMRGLKA